MKSSAIFPLAAILTVTSGASSFAKSLTVAPGQPQNWLMSSDGNAAGSMAFLAGPALSGAGALVLEAADGTQRAGVVTTALAGVKLRDLRELKLTLQYPLTLPGAGAGLRLQLDIDYDLKDGSPAPQGRLVFDPSSIAGAATGTWHTRDAMKGKWYMTGAATSAGQPAGQPFPQSAPATLAEIITRFPNAGIPAANGLLGIHVTGNASAFRAAVDSLTARHKGGSTVWNFEPDTDGDGVPDKDDKVPLSDRREKVDAGTGPTTIVNSTDRRGTTVQDRLLRLLDGSPAPAKFLKSVSSLAAELARSGTITKQQQQELTSAAGLAVSRATGATVSAASVYSGSTITQNSSLSLSSHVTIHDPAAAAAWAGTINANGTSQLNSGNHQITEAGTGTGTVAIWRGNSGTVNSGTVSGISLSGNEILAGSGMGTVTAGGSSGGLGPLAIWLNDTPDVNAALHITGQKVGPLAIWLNDNTDAVTGTFAGLPEGSHIDIPETSGGPDGGLNADYWLLTYPSGNEIRLTYNPEPSSTPLAGALVKSGSGALTLNTAGSFAGSTVIEGGTLQFSGQPVIRLTGSVLNNGTIKVGRGTLLDLSGATFTNNGVLDAISGSVRFPASVIHGPGSRILDSSAVKVTSAAREGTVFRLTMESHTGHSYQLQRSDRPDGGYVSTGLPQAGSTGSVLTFTSEEAGAPRAFFRVVVDP